MAAPSRKLVRDSTDILFSSRFTFDQIDEVRRALGFPHTKYITQETLDPDRLFLHLVGSSVKSMLKIPFYYEFDRAPEIKNLALEIYGKLINKFLDAIKDGGDFATKLEEDKAKQRKHIDQIDESEKDKTWHPHAFRKRWKITDDSKPWESHAINTYFKISHNMFGVAANDRFIPSEGSTPASIAKFWGERHLEFNAYRKLGNELIDQLIDEEYSKQKLPLRKLKDRTVTIFAGPSGAGKTELFKSLINRFSRQGMLDSISNATIHDVDHSDRLVWDTALTDNRARGHLKDETRGVQTHSENSDMGYLETLRREDQKKSLKEAPDVFGFSVTVNLDAINDGLEGGGKVVIHYTGVSENVAKASDVKRRQYSPRAVNSEDVTWSVYKAPQSLPNITKTPVGSRLEAYLYERVEVESGQKLSAYISADDGRVIVYDIEALVRIMGYSDVVENNLEASAQSLMTQFLKDGYSMVFLDKSEQVSYTVNYEDGTPPKIKVITEPEQMGEVHEAIKGMADGNIISSASQYANIDSSYIKSIRNGSYAKE